MTIAKAPPAPTAKGYGAIVFAVVIWAGWIVATRDQVASTSVLDISLLRYLPPVVLLAPVWMRRGFIPRGEDWRLVAIMATGWGGIFVMLTAKGLETVPASLFGPLVPAMLPLTVGLWDRAVEGVRLRPQRKAGLALILISIALTIGPALAAGDRGFLSGVPYLLCAALGWSAFTIAFRRSTLSGVEAVAYISLWTMPFLLIAVLVVGTDIPQMSPGRIGWMVLSQGVLSGVVAATCFAYAVRHLGAARTSSFTSLVPMGAAVGGWLALGESVGPLGWAAVVFACLGVAMVNGAFAGLLRR
ncbi:MAG: drug/metabolite transporter (DMT)-like permease [Paracoccaceae bacterium]|jgi:drug/metabolite transporter (DMT)-like permease